MQKEKLKMDNPKELPMNFALKTYINKLKGQCFRLGFALGAVETPRETMALLHNGEGRHVILVSLDCDIFGGIPAIRAYLVNPPKYRWARAEGFTLDQMRELKEEKVFVEIDPKKVANYLL